MLITYCLHVLILLYVFGGCNVTTAMYINSSKKLEELLSGHNTQAENVYIELDSSKQYRLKPDKTFSHMTNVNFTIVSDSNDKYVDIHCSDGLHYHPTRGLAFINSTVTMKRVAFHNCGMNLQALPIETTRILNSKYLYYRPTQAVAILLMQCKVTFYSVCFNSSYGFAVIGFNMVNSVLRNIATRHSLHLMKEPPRYSIGCGIMVHFNESEEKLDKVEVLLSDSVFENNFDIYQKQNCEVDSSFTNHNGKPIPIMNAPALTVFHTGRNSHIIIDNVTFSHNIGSVFGALLVFNYLNVSGSTTVLKNSQFTNCGKFNRSICHGDAMHFVWYWDANTHHLMVSDLLVMENVSLYSNSNQDAVWKGYHYKTYNLMFIEVNVQNVSTVFGMKGIQCNNNSLPNTQDSLCLMMDLNTKFSSSKIIAKLSEITAMDNIDNDKKPEHCLFHFLNIQIVFFNLQNTFSNNIGSAICGLHSTVNFNGTITFKGNIGINGGAVNMNGHSYLVFTKGVKAKFINNTARSFGGAIYIDSNSYDKCGLQIQTFVSSKRDIVFENNSANTAGNSIFTVPIDHCIDHDRYHSQRRYFLYDFFNLLDYIEQYGRPLQISTTPIRFSIIVHEYPLKLFPGGKFIVKILSTDNSRRNVFSFVNTEVYSSCNNVDIWLYQYGSNKVIENINGTIFNFSVHTANTEAKQSAKLVFSIPNLYQKTIDVILLQCPLGFSLGKTSGSCECSQLFENITGIKCFIDHKIILRPQYLNLWVGNIGNATALSKSCPISYCSYLPSYPYFKSISEGGMVLYNDNNNTKPICSYNRTDILCGKCDPQYNLSVVFGTSECKQCSDIWLLTILVYVIAGLVLVIILYSLNLTLSTGKLNGIIFYAQLANAGLTESLSLPIYSGRYLMVGHIRHVCFTILSLLNLNLGFPLCFYNGMNQLWKTGLSLLFPVHLILIVALIIVISRYSTWLSNKTSHSSVQVLVTVVHLSFSKLLLSLVDVFTPATIHTSNTPSTPLTVWYWDGSVQYMTDHHLLLAIISLLIVSVCLIPYVTILLLGKVIIRYSKRGKLYLRPVYDAIHAPYKEGKQIWFVARLLVLVLIYLMYVFFRTRNISILYVVIATLLALYLIGQTLFQPYKSKAMTIQDCWLILNIIMVYIALTSSIKSMKSTTFILIAVLLALVTFTVVVVHHVLTKNYRVRNIVSKSFQKLCFIFGLKQKNKNVRELKNSYSSCDEYREPLIETDNDDYSN